MSQQLSKLSASEVANAILQQLNALGHMIMHEEQGQITIIDRRPTSNYNQRRPSTLFKWTLYLYTYTLCCLIRGKFVASPLSTMSTDKKCHMAYCSTSRTLSREQ